MIERFNTDTALLIIDAQVGVDDLNHWGGASGRRNNLEAEKHIRLLLEAFREKTRPVVHTIHDSRESTSPLKLALPGGRIKPGLEPQRSEPVISKDVNSGFIGTNLELILRRRKISRLVVAGFFTNMCVETTVRMAGNMGFDTYLVHDACACTNRIGPDGSDHDPDLVHRISIANLHGEFCTALSTRNAIDLLENDAPDLSRAQGNE